MKLSFKHTAALLAIAATSIFAKGQADMPATVIHAKIDSTQVTMSGRTMLRIEVLKNGHKGAIVGLPVIEPGKTAEFHGVEVREINVDSTALNNGRMQVNYNILVQPFEVGDVTFPKFKYVVDSDTSYSEVTSMKVLEPQMPKEMRDSLYINPMEGPVSIKGRWYDFVPEWWYWAVIIAAVIALIVVVAMLYKKNGPTLLPHKKVIPPYVLAMDRLSKLKAQKLAESGHEKEYYTELTDIFRQYLEGRFGIYAREMTTTQILDAMHANPMTKDEAESLLPMLETADFVKFAKVRPLPDENIRSYNVVHEFVEKTKPVEETPDDSKNVKKGSKGKKAKNKKHKKN
jgi:hypothetical protein